MSELARRILDTLAYAPDGLTKDQLVVVLNSTRAAVAHAIEHELYRDVTTEDFTLWRLRQAPAQPARPEAPRRHPEEPAAPRVRRPQNDPDNQYEHFDQWPPLADHTPVGRPNATASVHELFKYVVRKEVSQGRNLEYRLHNQWASFFFNYLNNGHRALGLMSSVKHDFSAYFIMEGRTRCYTFDRDKIIAHYPQWFRLGNEAPQAAPEEQAPTDLHLLAQLAIQALQAEIYEARNPHNRETYTVASMREMAQHNGSYIYTAELNTTADSDPHFREGLAFRLRIGTQYYTCETVDYDFDNGVLYFTSPSRLSWRSYDNISAIVDLVFLLENLQSKMQDLRTDTLDDNLPIVKFIARTTRNLSSYEYAPVREDIYSHLDDSQRKAFFASLDHDITFVWGPPGTGKSFTLASIIRALYTFKDERTAVCCISNVAVDQLVGKVLDVLESEHKTVAPGNFYRAGHTIDDRILSTPFLFPSDQKTEQLRSRIQRSRRDLDRAVDHYGKASQQAIEIKADIKDLRAQLEAHTDHLVQSSRVVFSTIANFISSRRLGDAEFDNLIVDEASMLAFPNLLALARKVKKRIILVGDFQQLSPIALTPNRMLTRNVFDLCGISLANTSHPALHQLLNQRRSHSAIVELINGVFYDRRLRAVNTESNPIIESEPFPRRPIVFRNVQGGAVRFTRGGTRQNERFSEEVMRVLDWFAEDLDASFSIGIITPYKGQANMLRAKVAQRSYLPQFRRRVKIGTVHTFQGSECDAIIFDMVDCSVQENGRTAGIGKIYGGAEGEELINVAVSRARHKLIVVGDADYIRSVPGNIISASTHQMFRKLTSFR